MVYHYHLCFVLVWFYLQESQSGIVELPFDSVTVKGILSYIYGGQKIIKPENVADIYYAANYLTITSLIQDCEEFLQNELPEHVSLEIWQIARMFDKDGIAEIAKSKVLQDFTTLCNRECMSILSVKSVMELLRDPFLNCSGTLKCRAAWIWVTSNDNIEIRDVQDLVRTLTFAKNVENDDILCACANEAGDQLAVSGDNLERAQEMWINACDKLWIKPSAPRVSNAVVVPSENIDDENVLVILDEDQNGVTRITFFNYREKKWYKIENLSSLELGHRYAVCADGSLLYLSGGIISSRNQKRFVRFDCGTKESISLVNMPAGREQHTMCKVGRYFYVLGGVSDDEPKLADVHRYSLERHQWFSWGEIACPVSQHSSVTHQSVVYLLGGCTRTSGTAPCEIVQSFDTRTKTSGYLDMRMSLKCKASITSMTVVKDTIYFLHNGRVYKFEPKSKALGDPVCKIDGAPAKGFAFVSFESRIIAVGGEDDCFRTVRAVYQYDSHTDRAVKLPQITPWPLQDFRYVKMKVPSSWALEEA